MSSQHGELRPTIAAPQQISTGFASSLRYCIDVAQRRSTKLCTMFGRLLGWYTNEILPGAKFTLRPSLAFSYIGSVTARHEQWASVKLCGVQQRAPPIFGRAAITLGIGHILVLFVLLTSFSLSKFSCKPKKYYPSAQGGPCSLAPMRQFLPALHLTWLRHCRRLLTTVVDVIIVIIRVHRHRCYPAALRALNCVKQV